MKAFQKVANAYREVIKILPDDAKLYEQCGIAYMILVQKAGDKKIWKKCYNLV